MKPRPGPSALVLGALLLLACFPILVYPRIEAPFSAPRLWAAALIALILLAEWVKTSRAQGRCRQTACHLLAMTTLCALVLGASLRTGTPTLSLNYIGWIAAVGITCFGTATFNISPKQRILLLSVLAATASAAALYGILQAAGIDPLFSDLLRSVTPENSASRIVGTVGYQNSLGHLMIIACPLLVFLAGRTTRPRTRVAWLACLGLCALAALLTRSRGAWLGLATALTVQATILIRRRGAQTAYSRGHLIAALTTTVALIGIAQLLTRHDSSTLLQRGLDAFNPRSASLTQRTILADAGKRMISEKPFLGHGPQQYAYQFLDRVPATIDNADDHTRRSVLNVNHAHNEWIEIAAEHGVPAAIAVTGLLILLGRALWKRTRAKDQTQAALSTAALSVLTGIAAASVLSFPCRVPALVGPICLLFALALPICGSGTEHPQPRLSSKYAAVGLVLSLPLVLVGFLYQRHFTAGVRAAQSGDWHKAISAYQRAAALAPWNGRTRFYLGSTLLASDQPRLAATQFETAMETFSDTHLWRNQARASLALNTNAVKAVSLLERALATGIEPDATRVELAHAQIQTGQIPQAMLSISQLPSRLRHAAEIMAPLGKRLLSESDPVDCIAVLSSFAVSPTHVAATAPHRILASSNRVDAVACNLQCITLPLTGRDRIDRMTLTPITNVRLLAISLQHADQWMHVDLSAVASFVAAASTNQTLLADATLDGHGYCLPLSALPPPRAQCQTCHAMWQLHQRNSLPYACKLTGQSVDLPAARYSAIRILCTAIDSPYPRSGVIQLHALDRTIPLPIRAYDWCTSDAIPSPAPTANAEALELLGIAWLQLDQAQIAAIQLEEACQISPQDISIRNNLAAAHYTAGNYAAARRGWLSVLALDPENETAGRNIRSLPH